jgi:hypothetical protein
MTLTVHQLMTILTRLLSFTNRFKENVSSGASLASRWGFPHLSKRKELDHFRVTIEKDVDVRTWKIPEIFFVFEHLAEYRQCPRYPCGISWCEIKCNSVRWVTGCGEQECGESDIEQVKLGFHLYFWVANGRGNGISDKARREILIAHR